MPPKKKERTLSKDLRTVYILTEIYTKGTLPPIRRARGIGTVKDLLEEKREPRILQDIMEGKKSGTDGGVPWSLGNIPEKWTGKKGESHG